MYWAVGSRALRQGDINSGYLRARTGPRLAQGAHIRSWSPRSRDLGGAYTLAWAEAEALPLLEQAIAQAIAMHYMINHALRVVWLGEAYLHAGRLVEASAQAQRALEFSQRHQGTGP